MMNRKGPWEGYRRQARERHLGMRQALNATDREEGIFIQLAFGCFCLWLALLVQGRALDYFSFDVTK